MKMSGMDDENLRKIYEQYWSHARHQEVQRLWFTNIYAMIVTGAFAYFGAIKRCTEPLLIFLILLSFLGYLLTYTWNIPFTIFSRLAEQIAICEWNLPKDYRRFTKYKRGYEFSELVSANTIFTGFYSLMTGVFVGLFLQTIFKFCMQIASSIMLIVFLILLSFYKFYLKSKSIDKIQNNFEERVRVHDQRNQR